MVRGEIVCVPARQRARGHEQRSARPAVVVQSDDLLALSTVLVAPTSRSAHPATFRPLIDLSGTATRVLTDQVRAVNAQSLGGSLGRTQRRGAPDARRCARAGVRAARLRPGPRVYRRPRSWYAGNAWRGRSPFVLGEGDVAVHNFDFYSQASQEGARRVEGATVVLHLVGGHRAPPDSTDARP